LMPAVASAQGQSLANGIRANIPFDFSVADKKLPSGKYSVGRGRQDSDDSVLSITDTDGRSKSTQISIPVVTLDAKEKTILLFHRYGDQYFLFEVWVAGETTGRQFPKSKGEREAERNVTANSLSKRLSNNTAVETVTIVGGVK